MDHSFFPETVRREVRLRSAVALFGKNEEKQIKLLLSMPLTGQALVGMPQWMHNAHEAVCNGVSSATVDCKFEGMNIDVFATDQSDRDRQLPACQLKKFAAVTKGDPEIPEVDLLFVAYAPFSREAWAWAGEIVGMSFFVKFIQTQTELFAEKKADDAQMELDDISTDGIEEDGDWAAKSKAAAESLKKEEAPRKGKAKVQIPRGFEGPTNASAIH
jgi:hypothetical protein